MITRFKIFEQKERQIWVIPVKLPDFIISLKKIGMDNEQIDDWLRLRKNKVFSSKNGENYETITIEKHHGGYTWYWYPSTEGNEYTDFMGKLEFTPEEIQNYYNDVKLKEDAKKYNL